MSRSQNHTAVDVVLHLKVNLVANADRTESPIAGKMGDNPFIGRGIAGGSVDRVQFALGGFLDKKYHLMEAEIALHRSGDTQAVLKRVDDEVGITRSQQKR
ncbi:MAG: hypothetical protein FD153_1836 [Rhodospirillaceae bacterium]|nr:MAG: hypothetical protein FD153_1836 [Rhodospirillaceae bacterium]